MDATRECKSNEGSFDSITDSGYQAPPAGSKDSQRPERHSHGTRRDGPKGSRPGHGLRGPLPPY